MVPHDEQGNNMIDEDKYNEYRDAVKHNIKVLMHDNDVIKLMLKSLNTNEGEEATELIVHNSYLHGLSPEDATLLIADKAGVIQYVFEQHLKGIKDG